MKEQTGSKNRVPELGRWPGAAVFWPSDSTGWDHPPLYLPRPVLVLRVSREGTRVETPDGQLVTSHPDATVTPFKWIEEILDVLSESAKGTARKLFMRPICPLAVVCASYEYGRYFNPHEGCFPHAAQSEVDDLLVAFHSSGFARIDNKWSLVGRPPSRLASWRGWQISEFDTDWPKPPAMMPEAPPKPRTALDPVDLRFIDPQATMSRAAYEAAVARIKDHLAAGDIYQANLTVRFDGQTPAQAERIFAAGLRAGGERFAGMVRTTNSAHISFSPELLVRKWGRSIATRPIKGTLARNPDIPFKIAARELVGSAKDRAEHVMIVDLERNDLGRLCEYGSVRVDPLMEVTEHPNVLHMESLVTGTLRSGVTWREVFASMFPGGSVTGAPKKRALEVIASVESKPRGIYCGAMGWIDARGDCEFNLPIRTATLFDDKRLHLYAGGGIVADSTAENEWQEMRHKVNFIADAVRAASQPT